MTTSTHRSADERRAQLVDAAVAVMTDEGVRAVTTRAVTARAGLPHGTFAYCFGSKGELFRAVLDRELRRSMASAFDDDSAPTDDPCERIVAGLLASLDRVRAAPEEAMALLELTALARRDPELRDLARWEQTAYVSAVTENLTRWSDAHGRRWSVPTEHVGRLLVAVVEGAVSAWLSDRDDAAAEATLTLGARVTGALAVRDADAEGVRS
ncbi:MULTISPECIES: TetR/AcrR family transcriptional regulator [unclassified Curtobacterium]|uniref:TetR/AcrR family transcriptional regulator n=1 Tax=unclassified Curtobacterium TaxID=257496 RepID=UPI00226B9348|nr:MULTISPECIES: TetR/AcrR family transcriptional regulator [unclassified Curtobacterium]